MSSLQAIVVGAGVGGLAAAIRLQQRGCRVRLIEARAQTGGLASGFECEGLSFDAGPYILLDRPGLEWAFARLGLDVGEQAGLLPIDAVYEVCAPDSPPVRFYASLEETAAVFERSWPGSGAAYRRFIDRTETIHRRLLPLQWISRPRLLDVLRAGASREIPFLLRSLGSVLRSTGLPGPIQQAVGVWTQVAGQSFDSAPSPLALVPALIHRRGAFLPRGGVSRIAIVLENAARNCGVELALGTRAKAIRVERQRVIGVEQENGGFCGADVVVACVGAPAVYTKLLTPSPPGVKRRMRRLPLQSPGVCAYLAVKRSIPSPYLRFFLPRRDETIRLLVAPSAIAPELEKDGWWPARLISPMAHAEAETGGEAAQQAHLERVLSEPWWKEVVGEHRVLSTRIPVQWGREFSLHRDSMNPVMTAAFMRRGRFAHRSPFARGLYLAGSSTHPGQWVSFCAVSGILAADSALEDFR